MPKSQYRSNASSVMSLTLTLTVFAANYFSAIDLSDGDYLAIFKIYHTILNVNESKFYFTKDDIEITISEGSYEVRNINEFLTRAILRNHRPYHACNCTLS